MIYVTVTDFKANIRYINSVNQTVDNSSLTFTTDKEGAASVSNLRPTVTTFSDPMNYKDDLVFSCKDDFIFLGCFITEQIILSLNVFKIDCSFDKVLKRKFKVMRGTFMITFETENECFTIGERPEVMDYAQRWKPNEIMDIEDARALWDEHLKLGWKDITTYK